MNIPLATLLVSLLLPLVLVPGCPSSGGDDVTADDDDDTTSDDDVQDDDDDDDSASGNAPVISAFQIWIDIPDGEVEEMVNFAFSFEDVEGDIQGGYFILSWVDLEGYGTAVSGPVEQPDATSGTLDLGYVPIGPDWGFPSGASIPFTTSVYDRAENHSNELEETYVFP